MQNENVILNWLALGHLWFQCIFGWLLKWEWILDVQGLNLWEIMGWRVCSVSVQFITIYLHLIKNIYLFCN